MSGGELRTAVHARITPDAESGYVATCEEIAVVTQGETLDEVTASLREAVALHFEGEDMAALGFVHEPTIIVILELAPTHVGSGASQARS
ncbi:MAG: type II toxin-antitoxin system HicB family antitoxin [Candidatus Rokubacteria bacterium]|nr:type II toxin-antitoxin system HicB family antitoxin [Candidatus Rokubacteria bacterium]